MSQQTSLAVGQRWLSTTEPDLGLGTVVSLNQRSTDVLFPATGETRTYSRKAAPLTRIMFEVGDLITSHEGWQCKVTGLAQENGQITYQGLRLDSDQAVTLNETLIDHHFQLTQADERLYSGQFDNPKWFALREACIEHQYHHATSPLLGFLGARVELIAHQLHIAAEVGRRHSPRVLLADEVGLGKTVEAALIIHQQLLTGRAQRVLIVVPSSLVHQWLVEMLRRVNLAFSIFDEARCEALAHEQGNPFESEQLVICSLDFLTHNSQYYQQAMRCSWDLLVVDEAHHLTWNEGQGSQAYQAIEGLAKATDGVLLLTATPDQLGHESHFARLRLLDPARFHDYATFVKEEQRYSRLASAIQPLLSGENLSDEHIDAIAGFAGDEMPTNIATLDEEQRQQLLRTLLDRHGTGRLLFRNSRAGIAGFPCRILRTYPLPMPELYLRLLEQSQPLELHVAPERHAEFVDEWARIDPRVNWLVGLLQELKGEKILAICARAVTALQLEEALRTQAGIRASVFHEGMSIVERDRAANYFAQREDGAQILICSEIGSEGRNFQFAHHMVLFDLPMVPDLLEQRIGRLDRIGQTRDIEIHLPYFEDSAQEVLVNWYHRGLNAFEQTCPTGATVFEETEEALVQCLLNPKDTRGCESLVQLTAELHRALKLQLESGRDRLLELNSSGKGQVETLLARIEEAEQSVTLERFMTRLFDAVGVLQEEQDESCYFLRPTESMHTQLPGLPDEGMTVTYERETATALEHVHFLSWDHPMVRHAMDMILTDVLGKSAIALAADKTRPAGSYWLECIFTVAAKAPAHLQLERFLPATPLRYCVNPKGEHVEQRFYQLQGVNQKMAQQLVSALKPQLMKHLHALGDEAETGAQKVRTDAVSRMQTELGRERERLLSLKKVNPSVRDEEIAHLSRQIEGLTHSIAQARVSLEAIRLVVNNP